MTEARHQLLLAILKRSGEVGVDDLARELAASAATVRRDLVKLGKDGALIRTFGGARLQDAPSLTVRLLKEKREVMKAEKRWIAREAARLVEPGMSIVLDSGSTTWCLAEALKDRAPLDVVTNALPVVEELGTVDGIHIHLVGGRYNVGNHDLLGSDTAAAIAGFHADVAFIGVDSLIPGRGVFANTQDDANLLKAMAHCADQLVVVADHTKIDSRGLFLAVPSVRVNVLVTDSGIDPETRRRLEQSESCRLIIAEDVG